MTHFGLFEGIGGFSLAARWMGWETLAWCEINPFCQTVLQHHFPNAIGYGDIKTVDFSPWAGRIDILTGGFPCQPYSQAGKKLGTEDDRHLWPEMLRAIQEINPLYIVGENVRGFIGWNGGVVFEQACSDLENEGYEVITFTLPALGIDAPHIRERIWIVAKSKEERLEGFWKISETRSPDDGQRREIMPDEGNICNDSANANEERQSTRFSKPVPDWARQLGGGHAEADWKQPWGKFPTKPPIFQRNDGFPQRLGSFSFSGWANESIGAAGNAVVPQLAYRIFMAIQIAHLDSKNKSLK